MGEYPEEVVLGGEAENYRNIKTKRCFDTGFDITEGKPGFILGVGSFVINYIYQLVYVITSIITNSSGLELPQCEYLPPNRLKPQPHLWPMSPLFLDIRSF